MDEILRNLLPGARVLDLGCRTGSFPHARYPLLKVVAFDLEPLSSTATPGGVQGDAEHLPFRDAAFDAVISNHSLEHMVRLDRVLAEIGRVVRAQGSLYVSVPDASTFSDRLYRWIYHGGGHVNPFIDPAQLARRIHQATGLPLKTQRTLHASFLYLARHHFRPRPPRRMWLFANGSRTAILALSWLSRTADRLLGTRLSVYGWGFCFGDVKGPVDTLAWTNVCVDCGSATPADSLPVTRRFLLPWYECPGCGTWNLFTPDRC